MALLGILSAPWWGRATHWILSAVCFFLLVLGIVRQADTLKLFYISGSPEATPPGPAQQVRLVLANIGSENTSREEAINLLRSTDAHVMALLEVKRETLERFAAEFPYRLFVEQVQEFGIGVVSKLPPASSPRTSLGLGVRPAMVAAFALSDGQTLPIIAFDALPPFGPDEVEQSWLTTRRLATLVRFDFPSAVVLTDLNATPFSRFYRVFVKEASVRDVFWGRGMVRTWDMTRWWMRFQIDHVFVKGALRTRQASIVDLPGSDHRALVVDLDVFKLGTGAGLP